MNKHDLRTLETIDSRHGLLNVIQMLLLYVRESNKELVDMKRELEKIAGRRISPRTPQQLKSLREGGDLITAINKAIDKGRELKNATKK